MNLDDRQPGLNEDSLAVEKELKVRIPVDFHIKLHTLKVLHGQPIHVTVKDALRAYFEAFDEEASARRIAAWQRAAAAPAPTEAGGPSTGP